MKDLNYDFKNLCMSLPQGSRSTQAARFKILQMVSEHLHAEGFKLPSIKSLKPKHIDALLQRWKGEELSAGTLKNRMSHIRWWAEQVGKKSILKSNEDYGIPCREMHKGNKAQKLDLDKLQGIDCPRLKMAVRLQAAFGLRREEALKFQPRLADKGDCIALKASWCKGGRARVVPILNERQRDLLNEAHELVGSASMIPDDKKYIDHLNTYNHQVLQAGFSKLHGLRHNYAQWRYKQLTGENPPAQGGIKRAEMTPEQAHCDILARREISRELGHDRIDVTNVYLGGAK